MKYLITEQRIAENEMLNDILCRPYSHDEHQIQLNIFTIYSFVSSYSFLSSPQQRPPPKPPTKRCFLVSSEKFKAVISRKEGTVIDNKKQRDL